MILLHQASCVAIGARALLIEGAPGSGKSSLALALIDRGARLIGDDGVRLEARQGRLFASPPPNIAGLVEVRNLGLIEMPTVSDMALALVLRFDPEAPRFIDAAEQTELGGIALPLVRLWPESPVLAIKAELALERFGLA
ncbi:HPr kinase/phosphatase C-terminal domain-containing protein [Novosphingobium sp.]|uniref:HPr kinase/phosphorylase n=1 Tax=Novosphingobium sp. TaxID=1874826 RepID=UPI00261DD472|nr:HPr kinase/phosphatase C-terminal domain-containing protein [Novosphingobium sp.]